MTIIFTKNDSFFLQVQLLWPSSPQCPQVQRCLPRAKGLGDGGTSDGVKDGGGRRGDGGQGPGPENGHTRSLDSGEQNSLIFWYKYHLCSIESPLGAMQGGSSFKDGTQSFVKCIQSAEIEMKFLKPTTTTIIDIMLLHSTKDYIYYATGIGNK